MINQVTLVGRLTKEPEVKTTSDDTAVLNITLALNRFGRGRRIEQEADFIPCVIWGRRAEETAKYCRKGSLIGLTGEIQTRSYLNKEEKRIFIVEVVAHKIRYLSSARAEQKNDGNKDEAFMVGEEDLSVTTEEKNKE
ncbi:single-stranded DNA-binding protein [Listeria costaricensis]|uniref:single-stranded DNA-binding protein n=1 Tax=Listeria costaricensis TaxID=2026604 RepID=UPI000C0847C4|nr:single-stranded DNA-binding protein [Listeria costaricensis]